MQNTGSNPYVISEKKKKKSPIFLHRTKSSYIYVYTEEEQVTRVSILYQKKNNLHL